MSGSALHIQLNFLMVRIFLLFFNRNMVMHIVQKLFGFSVGSSSIKILVKTPKWFLIACLISVWLSMQYDCGYHLDIQQKFFEKNAQQFLFLHQAGN